MTEKNTFKRYANIMILPYSELLERPSGKSIHRGGVVWDDWEYAGFSRHNRGGQPVDDYPSLPDIKPDVLNGTFAWCGAIVNHFGHQIADFSTRIAMYGEGDHLYCFSKKPGLTPPKFFWDIIDWFLIPRERVFIVEKPVIVESLIVAPQQEQLVAGALPPSRNYLELLDTISKAHNSGQSPKNNALYVSRAGLKSGLIAGEKYFEGFLKEKGIRVIRPETLTLVEQLRLYAMHKTLIFSEGSALHGLQLLGRGLGSVHILNRRPRQKMIEDLLKPRVDNLSYHDIGQIVCPLSASGRKAMFKGITIPLYRRLIELFNSLDICTDGFSSVTLKQEIEKDVYNWFKSEIETMKSVKGHDSIALVRNDLKKHGFDF